MIQCANRLNIILCSMEREERLRRRRELYQLSRNAETPEQREVRLAARSEQERRRKRNDASSLFTITKLALKIFHSAVLTACLHW